MLFSLYSGGYSGMCGVWGSLLLLDYIYKPTTDDRVNDSEWVIGWVDGNQSIIMMNIV